MRQWSLVAAVLLGTVLVGAVIGTAIGKGAGGGGTSTPTAVFRPAVTGELITAPGASPKKLDKPLALGSRSAGLAVVALSPVDRVKTEDGVRRPPEGSRMVAFKVADWTCEDTPCESWDTLDPQVSIDGTTSSLESGQNTYVVVVPPGTDEVDLVVDADEFSQSVSLLDGELGADNILLFGKRGLTKPIDVRQSFRIGERTSTPLLGPDGQPTDTFFRTVNVGDVQRQFFLDDQTPSDPARTFLTLSIAYTYDGQQQASAFDPSEIKFVLGDGRTFPAKDLDPSPEKALLGFEIPAKAKRGTIVIGGTFEKTSTTGVAYSSTLGTKEIEVDLKPAAG
ncbi:hypothetical protein [Marmoricola sp. OAE513]|uniref:hypothetical protein n=1 Tax=Marmoricola sp. OAE513 TaxID=2817894 RepID=UPI003392CDD1